MNEKQQTPIPILGKNTAERVAAPPVTYLSHGRGLLALFASLLHPAQALALSLPVVWGLTLAQWHGAALNGWLIALLLIAQGAFFVGLNLAGQYTDFRWGLKGNHSPLEADSDLLAPSKAGQPPQDALRLLHTRRIRPGAVRSLVFLCIWINLLSYTWLSQLVGWPLFFFGVLSLLLAVVSLLPIIRYSRWLWLLGDLAILIAVGVLPLLSAYYGHWGMIDRWVLLASGAPAVLTWLTFMSYNLLSWRRDWRLQRGTAVAIFGPERALDGAAVMSVAAFTSVLLLMAVGALPLSSLLVLGALPIFLRAFTNHSQQPITYTSALYVINRSTQAAILAGLLWMLALWTG